MISYYASCVLCHPTGKTSVCTPVFWGGVWGSQPSETASTPRLTVLKLLIRCATGAVMPDVVVVVVVAVAVVVAAAAAAAA